MCGGGGGGSGTQRYEWNDQIAPYWQQALARGQDLSNTPYEAYTGQRIADITPDQQGAMDAIRNFVKGSGNDATIAANGMIQKTEMGDYLSGNDVNPWSTKIVNPYIQDGYNGIKSPGENKYAGADSGVFRSNLQSGLRDITDAYKNGTSADTTRLFNLSGAFGGSAHQNAIANNERELGRTVDNYVMPMINNQLQRSAGLEENNLNRQLDVSKFNDQLRSGLFENMLNRGNQAYENERNRQIQTISPGQNEQQLALQRYQALMGIGDINRSYNQDLLNQGYQDWQAQKQYPYNQLDYLTGLLSRAQGGVSPNMTSQMSGYSASPFSQLLGAGLLGYSMFGRNG